MLACDLPPLSFCNFPSLGFWPTICKKPKNLGFWLVICLEALFQDKRKVAFWGCVPGTLQVHKKLRAFAANRGFQDPLTGSRGPPPQQDQRESKMHRIEVHPKGPNLEKFQDRLKFSISLENFNLAWNFQSWPPEFPTKIGVWWVARLKISSSLENFKILKFFKIWALRAPLRITGWPNRNRRNRFSRKRKRNRNRRNRYPGGNETGTGTVLSC